MKNQNYRYEDIFPSGQFAGWHNFTQALLGALSVLVNGETAPAVLASLIIIMSDVSSLQSELCVHRSPGPGFFIQLNFERQMTSHLPKHLGSKFDVSPWGPRKALSFTSKGHCNWLELSKAQDSLITKAEFPAQDCINSVSRSSSSFRLYWHANFRC